jgi:hypothetical protein
MSAQNCALIDAAGVSKMSYFGSMPGFQPSASGPTSKQPSGLRDAALSVLVSSFEPGACNNNTYFTYYEFFFQ